jgi:hypothetical protein
VLNVTPVKAPLVLSRTWAGSSAHADVEINPVMTIPSAICLIVGSLSPVAASGPGAATVGVAPHKSKMNAKAVRPRKIGETPRIYA